MIKAPRTDSSGNVSSVIDRRRNPDSSHVTSEADVTQIEAGLSTELPVRVTTGREPFGGISIVMPPLYNCPVL